MGKMNKIQKQFVNILSASIRRQSVTVVDIGGDEWGELIEEAEAHKVSALIYKGCKNILNQSDIPMDILKKWKKDVIMESFRQSEQMKKISFILEILNQSDIQTIVLKGVILRNLYPSPDLRTMNDVDLLVHKRDLKNVENTLLKQGYRKYTEQGEKHDVYVKSGWPIIEVHWMLSHERTFKGCVEYEQGIWNRVREVEVLGVKAFTLGYNDFLLHLMIHMASHAASHGFGVRFLTDIILMIEREQTLIDWEQFKLDIAQCEISTFTGIMLRCCEDLFNFKIPQELEEISQVDLKYLKFLETEILDSGVHGLREKETIIVKEMAYDRSERNLYKRFLKFIFPPIEKMSSRYEYAKKNRFLLPFAWGHHLLAGIFHSEYSLSQKLTICFLGIKETKKKSQLIRWLELE